MEEILGFNKLKVGQSVKARGKWGEGNTFGAVEISMKSPSDDASIEAAIQEIDYHNRTMSLLDRKFELPEGIVIKGLQNQIQNLEDLHHGVMVKLKGKYSPHRGFSPEQIKVKETRSFNIDLLQGNIDYIDRESKILNVAGFNIKINPKTMITGL